MALHDGNSFRNDRYGRILCVARLYFTIKIIVTAKALIDFYINGRVLTFVLFQAGFFWRLIRQENTTIHEPRRLYEWLFPVCRPNLALIGQFLVVF